MNALGWGKAVAIVHELSDPERNEQRSDIFSQPFNPRPLEIVKTI